MQDDNKEILNINKRIIQIVDYHNLTRYKFSQETGISDAVLFNIYKGKNKPSFDLIEKILNKYKTIDANWLLTGKGQMFKKEIGSNIVEESVPLYIKEDSSITNDPLLLKKTINESVSVHFLDKIIELSSENALLKKELTELRVQKSKK